MYTKAKLRLKLQVKVNVSWSITSRGVRYQHHRCTGRLENHNNNNNNRNNFFRHNIATNEWIVYALGMYWLFSILPVNVPL